MKRPIFILIVGLFASAITLHAKKVEKIYMVCSGDRVFGKHYFTDQEESLLLEITGESPKSIVDWGKSFGTLTFSKSKIPWSYNSTLRLCGEDKLKYVLEPICISDRESWPENVSSIDRDCTLDKVTGKFYCRLSIYHKDKTPQISYSWDYDCKVVAPELKL